MATYFRELPGSLTLANQTKAIEGEERSRDCRCRCERGS